MKLREKPLIERLLYQLYRRRSGEVQALHDAATQTPAARLGLLFAATIILPAFLLVLLSLSSVTAEEVAIEAEVENAAATAILHTKMAIESPLQQFENAASHFVRERTTQEKNSISNLTGLSPFLETVFFLDERGAIIAPFKSQRPPGLPEPSQQFSQALLDGHLARQSGDLIAAAHYFSEAVSYATTPADAGDATFADAITKTLQTKSTHAQSPMHDVSRDYAHIRSRSGFKIGDLINLSLGVTALASEPDLGRMILKQMVDDGLSAPWVLDYPQDPSVIRLALLSLEQNPEMPWFHTAKERLDKRSRMFYWSSKLFSDIDAILSAPRRPGHEFTYISRPAKDALWAVYASDTGHTTLFILNRAKLVDTLQTSIQQLNAEAADSDTFVTLDPNDSQYVPIDVEYMTPWLPQIGVHVLPKTNDLLSRKKTRARTLRFTVVAAALATTLLGALISVSLIKRESEAARAKTDFAANVSHELRSPITQIRVRAEALQLGLYDNDQEKLESYTAIVQQSERLSRLVDNVLDFSVIEKGAKKYSFRPHDLEEVINNAVNSCEEMIRTENIRVDIDIPFDIPVVWIDSEAIAQVMINLLSNAVKYGASGEWIGIRVRDQKDTIELTISDHGAGIPEKDLPHVFSRFFRSSDTAVRSKRGTGIGLTIVQYIVEAHAGTIEVDSTIGIGTSFLITFSKENHHSQG
jgi:signal transduction histidine kinase